MTQWASLGMLHLDRGAQHSALVATTLAHGLCSSVGSDTGRSTRAFMILTHSIDVQLGCFYLYVFQLEAAVKIDDAPDSDPAGDS